MRYTESFDYVVVGGGTAGAIVASRLAEDPSVTVCLLEAGPPDHHPFLHLPAGFIKMLFNPGYTWTFSSEPHERTLGRRIPLPQGRTLGGSSAINGLIYNRGQAQDYDGWAALGNPGWAFADVLPYFQRSERWLGQSDSPLRGRNGAVAVTPIDWSHPICEAFLEGAAELGLPRNPDYNAEVQAGVGYFQRTIHRGWRVSTARAYLRAQGHRPNLFVRTHAQATRILFEGRRATGVEYVADQQVQGDDGRKELHGHRQRPEGALHADPDQGQRGPPGRDALARAALAPALHTQHQDQEAHAAGQVAMDHLHPGLAMGDRAGGHDALGRLDLAVGAQGAELAVAAGPVGAAQAGIGEPGEGAENDQIEGQEQGQQGQGAQALGAAAGRTRAQAQPQQRAATQQGTEGQHLAQGREIDEVQRRIHRDLNAPADPRRRWPAADGPDRA